MTLPSSLRRVLPLAWAALALASRVHAAPTPATLVVGGKPVPFIVAPYVGPEGQVFAPVDAVRLLDADFTPDTDAHTVTVTGEAGRSITVPYDLVQGRYCVPIQKVAQALGASTDWQPTTQTLTVRARLLMVRQDGGTLSIYTSYPVYYRVEQIDSPNRVFVDLYGLDLDAQAASIPVSGGNVLHIRSGQMGYNVVRIVVDLKRAVPFQVRSPLATDQVRVALGVSGPQPALPTGDLPPLPTVPGPAVATRPAPVLPVVPPAQAVQITDVSLKTTGPLTQILVTATGQAKYSTELLDNPARLAFDLAGATLDPALTLPVAADNPLLKQVRCGVFRSGVDRYGRVVVDLQRIVPFTVTHEDEPDGSTVYAINLQSPAPPLAVRPLLPLVPSFGTSLAGKIVVVDPGHGDQDSGAVGLGGVREKDLTLAIGLKLRDALTQNGATVYMTRDTDTFLPVMARPQFAIDHNADVFVSVHCDESGPPNSHSGTTVYYHAQDPICRRMAADIAAEIGQQTSLPANGTKSDTIRFASGFGVLRGSPMPAVLVECGYVNDAADLTKLTDPDTQQRIAEGIVSGLRDFLAGRTASR